MLGAEPGLVIGALTALITGVSGQGVSGINGSLVAPKGADVLTVGVIGGVYEYLIIKMLDQDAHQIVHGRLWLDWMETVSGPFLSRDPGSTRGSRYHGSE